MGSIKNLLLLVFVFSILSGPGGGGLYGQSDASGTHPVAAEVQNLEKKLSDRGIPAAERQGIMIRLAGLFRLLGDLESAARIWTEAAVADPGRRDDGALLEGARCFAALGELDKADVQVQKVLLTAQDAGILRNARCLGAQIRSFRSGDVSILTALTDDPEYRDYKAALYYTQWKVSGDDRYKARLLAECPGSPEARILGNDGGVVRAAPMVWWFLFPGRDAVTLAAPVVPAAPKALDPAPEDAGTAVVLQTGLFSREENARALVERLRRAGFQAGITRRGVKGVEYWAVTVPAGNDMGRTIIHLKDAGFESFPVFQ
ncbi:SPOR domain-containing protein [Treponema sp. TIM-1]|uniref:SPOR domain-containing protein n=1 Tax=Treponema sp. TIM-1 TaxID=2898417 RepID=UPI003980C5E2